MGRYDSFHDRQDAMQRAANERRRKADEARHSHPADVQAADVAVAAHEDAMRLEPDQPAETRLWHLLRSLLVWSDAYSVNFDAALSDVRDAMRRGEV